MKFGIYSAEVHTRHKGFVYENLSGHEVLCSEIIDADSWVAATKAVANRNISDLKVVDVVTYFIRQVPPTGSHLTEDAIDIAFDKFRETPKQPEKKAPDEGTALASFFMTRPGEWKGFGKG
jgi:hypothetical protein